jgi:hypothetical protein
MNSAKFRSATMAIGCFLSALSASAHPGHALREATPQHLLTSPDHLAVLALSGGVLWFAGRFMQRRMPRRLLQGAGLVAVLTAAMVWGIRT